MKAFNSIAFLVFSAFAALQLNDPDPVLWVSIYMSVAVLLLLRVFGFYHPYAAITLMCLLATYGLTMLPALTQWLSSGHPEAVLEHMSNEKPYIEISREFFGLLIAEAALAAQWALGKGR